MNKGDAYLMSDCIFYSQYFHKDACFYTATLCHSWISWTFDNRNKLKKEKHHSVYKHSISKTLKQLYKYLRYKFKIQIKSNEHYVLLVAYFSKVMNEYFTCKILINLMLRMVVLHMFTK